jgi:hypothetical protein
MPQSPARPRTGVSQPRARLDQVTTLDLLKTAAAVMMIADHVGLYFLDEPWLRIAGRGAAIIFGFLIGLSGSTRVPPSWIGLGLGLTLLNGWVTPNDPEPHTLDILISLALTRMLVPCFERLHSANPLHLVPAAIAMALLSEPLNHYLEYASEVTLLALLGIAIRLDSGRHGAAPARDGIALVAIVGMNILALRHFGFTGWHALGCIATITGTIIVLTHYRRRTIGMPRWLAPVVSFCGRNTLWIYAIHLAAFMLLGHSAETPTEE